MDICILYTVKRPAEKNPPEPNRTLYNCSTHLFAHRTPLFICLTNFCIVNSFSKIV